MHSNRIMSLAINMIDSFAHGGVVSEAYAQFDRVELVVRFVNRNDENHRYIGRIRLDIIENEPGIETLRRLALEVGLCVEAARGVLNG